MDSSYISLIFFILITIGYYFIKKSLKVEMFDNSKAFIQYEYSNYITMFVYFLAIVFTQFAFNIYVLLDNCGGSIINNIGSAGVITFLPWTFIFGIVMIVLIIFPGFKSAFSNVIGYFVVSGSANQILTTLLKAPSESSTPQSPDEETGDDADLVRKLLANTSILINQITPINFNTYWASLAASIMKPTHKNDLEIKQQLLDIVVRKDNIGEAFWYIYTAVLLISITQYSITSRGCVKDINAMKASHEEFLKSEADLKAQNDKIQSTVYKTTS
jgi:hypothetical protein